MHYTRRKAMSRATASLQTLGALPFSLEVVTNSIVGLLFEFATRDHSLALGDLRFGLFARHFNYNRAPVSISATTHEQGETHRECKRQRACR